MGKRDRAIHRFKSTWTRLPPKYRIVMVVAIVVILVALSLNMSGVSFMKEEIPIIGFDKDRAYRDMMYLTGLGPRHSGTIAEHKGAEYIANEMENAGLANVHIEDYEIFMFEVDHASVSLVEYGPAGILPLPFNARVTEFVHAVDFVVQGFSGSLDWMSFRDDLEVHDLGNSTDESAWSAAAGKAAIFSNFDGGPSNTELFRMAKDNNVGAIIILNTYIHKELNFLPIFKGTYFGEGEEYPDIPFFMVSRDMGNEILAGGANGSRLRVDMHVTRELRTIKVVIGDVPGREDNGRYVMIGAHHDTVYNGEGAVDNTSGTVTVLEMARNMVKERPKRTIRFATWGGEEEGLYGSFNYLQRHYDDIMKNMIFYENLDMPNIDLPRGNSGWIGTNDNSTIDLYREVIDRVTKHQPKFERYEVTSDYDPLAGSSDQAVFVAEGKKTCFVGGSGSWEYHTYLDDITHINPESLELMGMVISLHAYELAEMD